MKPEDYVTYPTAKLLKAAGYPQGASLWSYLADGKMVCTYDESGCCCDDPHLYDAMKWLRQEKKVWIQVKKNDHDPNWRSCPYLMNVDGSGNTYPISDYEYSPTYEASCDAGIAAACEWLLGKNHSEKE